jgi:hypothetical protein
VELLTLSAVYILIGLWLLLRHRGDFADRLRDGLRVPYAELEESKAAREDQPTK